MSERSEQQADEQWEIIEEHNSGEAGVGCDSGEAGVGCDSGDVSEGCDSGDVSGSVEAIRRVSVSQFGEFVSQHHAHGNKKFRDNFEVHLLLVYVIYTVHAYA